MEIPAPNAKRKRAAPKNDGEPSAKRQSSGGGPQGALLQEMEDMSSEDLLTEMREAIASDKWERRHQLMGGILAYHAVKDASRSKNLRKMARDSGGVSRKEIMDWMAASPKYAFWVKHTLNRVELSSYQSIVSRVLQKAGYERLGKRGRYVKWKLPPSVEVESEVSDEEAESDEGSDKDSGNASSNDDKKSDAGVEEEKDSGDDDDSDDDDDNAEVRAEESVAESNAKANDDDDSSGGSDSSDDNDESSPKPASSNKQDPTSEDGSNSDEDNSDEDGSDSDSSNDEEELAKANGAAVTENVEESQEDEDGSSSSGGDEGEDEDDIMADGDDAESPADD